MATTTKRVLMETLTHVISKFHHSDGTVTITTYSKLLKKIVERKNLTYELYIRNEPYELIPEERK